MSDRRWYDTDGKIADRTNTVINGLLDWARNDDVTSITRKNIEDAVRHLTPVDGDETVDSYVERVVTHGPFTSSGPAMWRINWQEATKEVEA